MTRLSHRCARILRIRSVEHRVAVGRAVAAERRIQDLLGVAQRLGDLRSSLRPGVGITNGQVLNAMAEMKERLERAEADLVRPIRQAAANRDHATAARLVARSREDGMGRLRDKAASGEEKTETLRAQANHPFHQVKRRLA